VIVFVGAVWAHRFIRAWKPGNCSPSARFGGHDIDGTEKVFLKALNLIKATVEADNLQISLD